MSKNILRDKTFCFSIRIVNLYKYLVNNHREFVLSKQILRSGTNPGAMCREAENAQSKRDFIHKYTIAQKEIAESMYWLELIHATDFIDIEMFNSIHTDAVEILKIIKSSINTARKNLSKGQ